MTAWKIYTDADGHGKICVVVFKNEERYTTVLSEVKCQAAWDAEWKAVIFAINNLRSLCDGIELSDTIDFYADSEYVIKQINGQYKVRNKELIPLYEEVMDWQRDPKTRYKDTTFTHVGRDDNYAGRILEGKDKECIVTTLHPRIDDAEHGKTTIDVDFETKATGKDFQEGIEEIVRKVLTENEKIVTHKVLSQKVNWFEVRTALKVMSVTGMIDFTLDELLERIQYTKDNFPDAIQATKDEAYRVK